MNLPQLSAEKVNAKKVLVRLDLDVDNDFSRIEMAGETLRFLVENKAKIIIIGHKGRPEGKSVPALSLARLIQPLSKVVGQEVSFEKEGAVSLKENLRFQPGEEANDENFARELAALGDFYVNEAFAVSHRSHASIVGLPKLLPHAAGFRFAKEVKALSQVLENPRRPIIAVISGVKKDKMEYIAGLAEVVDKVLVGGRLPEYYGDENPHPEKLLIGQLMPDKEDLTLNTIARFKTEIDKAGTIILAGVPGKYEDPGHRQATQEIFTAIAQSQAFKLLGGGDAEAAATMFGLNDKFDWISVGGGAMLEFLAKGSLPGIKALLQA